MYSEDTSRLHIGSKGNPSQQEAIRHFRGPCEVIAGPGSGKTFVLVERILFLIIECDVPPSQILVLTFSKAAAGEMNTRFQRRSREVLEENPQLLAASSSVTFGTFHSVFLNILQTSSPVRFSILDNSRSRNLLRTLFLRYYKRYPKGEELSDLAGLISKCKSLPSSENSVQTASSQTASSPMESITFRSLFADYQAYLQENSLLDFDDMIMRCVQLLEEDAALRQFWQKRFSYFLIDEFQDINEEQFRGIQILAGSSSNLFVVGDDDQSIYAFRGSNPEIMMRFPKLYPSTHSVTLAVNYRSLEPIVDCGQAVIAENQQRLLKEARASRIPEEGMATLQSCIQMLPFADADTEYRWLVHKLSHLTGEEQDHAAIIVRSHNQLNGIVEAMEEAGVAYRFFTGAQQNNGRAKERRKLLQKGADLLEIVAGYYRLGEQLQSGTIKRTDLFLVMNEPERFLLRSRFRKAQYTEAELLAVYPMESLEQQALRKLCRDLQTLQRLTPTRSLAYLKGILSPSGFAAASPPNTNNSKSVMSQKDSQYLLWQGLKLIAEECRTALNFRKALETTSAELLIRRMEEDSIASQSGNAAQDGTHGVWLLTMHASKGLEFDTVFLPDLNEGIFPGRRARSAAAIEEERRLFYVAITRARDQLILLYLRGTKENPRRPSRFLEPLGVQVWT